MRERRKGNDKEVGDVARRYGFFFFKQKTAYEILTCDWSSDVCSSDLYFMDGFGSDGSVVKGLKKELAEIKRLPSSKIPRKIGRASCRERV